MQSMPPLHPNEAPLPDPFGDNQLNIEEVSSDDDLLTEPDPNTTLPPDGWYPNPGAEPLQQPEPYILPPFPALQAALPVELLNFKEPDPAEDATIPENLITAADYAVRMCVRLLKALHAMPVPMETTAMRQRLAEIGCASYALNQIRRIHVSRENAPKLPDAPRRGRPRKPSLLPNNEPLPEEIKRI
ncbi:MAG: hypothetical protein K1X53_10240 [Candidatus Sumerlaeaceae bacterium]|nr:hypothetical protein [Candidatus Sumerlaeaceae bacterium]